MEQSKIIFDIPVGYPEKMLEVIEKFNSIYKADFEIMNEEDRDGVTFLTVASVKATIKDVYTLGLFAGMDLQKRRMLGETDE